jgi:hypothetical protein
VVADLERRDVELDAGRDVLGLGLDGEAEQLLVDDAACTAEWIATNVPPLVNDPRRLEAMSAAATSLGHRSADETMADLVLTAAGG